MSKENQSKQTKQKESNYMGHGIETKRDFQIGLAMAWHNLTRIQEKITRKDFPVIEARSIGYMNGKAFVALENEKEGFAYQMAFASDDNAPCGAPFNSKTYHLFTPHNAWDYVAECLKGTEYTVESVGMIKDRSVWFISVKLKELADLQVKGDESKTKFQLNFTGGLDRQFSPQCDLSAVRVVCANTVALTRMTGTVLFRAKLTKNFSVKLEESKKAVEQACGMPAIFAKAMNTLATQPANTNRAERIYAGFITPELSPEGKPVETMSTRAKNLVADSVVAFNRGIGNKGETLYDVLNGFTQLRTRGTSDSKKDVWSQFESSEFGLYADQKAEFSNLLIDEKRLALVETRGEALIKAS